MSIEVKISAFFTPYTNNQQVAEVKGKNVGECLNHLVKQFPSLKQVLFDKNNRLYSYFDIYINEESAYPEHLSKPVKDGDTLHIVMLLHGG